MNILIIDDEPLARLRLRGLIDGLEPLHHVSEVSHSDEALALLDKETCDLVLLDIHMPGLNGLELAQAIKRLPRPPAVVFVTAHAEHALQAFELQALDYLTKPVRRERLQAALARVPNAVASPPSAPPTPEPVIVVTDRGRVLRLPAREVLYLKAEQKYVTLRTATHTHVLDDSLTDLEQRLGPPFLRIHRNALVSVAAIRALEIRGVEPGSEGEGWAVRVAPLGEWLPVSRRQVQAVKAALART